MVNEEDPGRSIREQEIRIRITRDRIFTVFISMVILNKGDYTLLYFAVRISIRNGSVF
jgi:hypothetical protein